MNVPPAQWARLDCKALFRFRQAGHVSISEANRHILNERLLNEDCTDSALAFYIHAEFADRFFLVSFLLSRPRKLLHNCKTFRKGYMYNESMGVLIFFPIFLGLVTAWVVNYFADVLPESLRLGRPVCSNPQCQKPFEWTDYLLLRKCRHCSKGRGVRTFVVIFLCAISALYLWVSYPLKLGFGLSLLALGYFYIVGIIDLEHRLILGPLSIAGVLVGGFAGFLLHGWQSTLMGGAAGFVIMFVFYLFGKLFTFLRARRRGEDPKQAEEALGSGDVTLATILGLFLGWQLIWFGLLIGALIAGIISLIIVAVLMISRKYKQQAFMVYIPLGPMFILSAIMIIYLPSLLLKVVPK